MSSDSNVNTILTEDDSNVNTILTEDDSNVNTILTEDDSNVNTILTYNKTKDKPEDMQKDIQDKIYLSAERSFLLYQSMCNYYSCGEDDIEIYIKNISKLVNKINKKIPSKYCDIKTGKMCSTKIYLASVKLFTIAENFKKFSIAISKVIDKLNSKIEMIDDDF